MANHGVFVNEVPTSLSAPVAASSGIPYFVGCAPIQGAAHAAAANTPVLVTSWDEYCDKLGYSEDWADYSLCECAYSHFVLFNMQPAVFLNVFDPSTMKSAVTAADKDVSNHKVNLGQKGLETTGLVVKDKASTPNTLVKDTDYEVYFEDGEMIIELISTSTHYADTVLNIAYDQAVFSSITATTISNAIEKIELCMSGLGVIPDMIVAPGWSSNSSVAAVTPGSVIFAVTSLTDALTVIRTVRLSLRFRRA